MHLPAFPDRDLTSDEARARQEALHYRMPEPIRAADQLASAHPSR